MPLIPSPITSASSTGALPLVGAPSGMYMYLYFHGKIIEKHVQFIFIKTHFVFLGPAPTPIQNEPLPLSKKPSKKSKNNCCSIM